MTFNRVKFGKKMNRKHGHHPTQEHKVKTKYNRKKKYNEKWKEMWREKGSEGD